MIHTYSATYQNVIARPLAHRDIEYLALWRNNPNLSRFLSPQPFITKEMQEKWFSSYLKEPYYYIFAIEENQELKRMVGSVALYNFRKDTVECGRIMMGDPATKGKGIGQRAITLCLAIAFGPLQVKTVDLHVFRENIPAVITYKKVGFSEKSIQVVDCKEELYMTITKSDFNSICNFADDIQIER